MQSFPHRLRSSLHDAHGVLTPIQSSLSKTNSGGPEVRLYQRKASRSIYMCYIEMMLIYEQQGQCMHSVFIMRCRKKSVFP